MKRSWHLVNIDWAGRLSSWISLKKIHQWGSQGLKSRYPYVIVFWLSSSILYQKYDLKITFVYWKSHRWKYKTMHRQFLYHSVHKVYTISYSIIISRAIKCQCLFGLYFKPIKINYLIIISPFHMSFFNYSLIDMTHLFLTVKKSILKIPIKQVLNQEFTLYLNCQKIDNCLIYIYIYSFF